MKTKQMNGGFWAALAAVLLISAVLVIGCAIGDAFEGAEEEYYFTSEWGKGYLRFRINEGLTDARTLYPYTYGIAALSDFEKIDIIIRRGAATVLDILGINPFSVISGSILLSAGNYEVEVLGYMWTSMSWMGVSAAVGYAPVVVAAGKDPNVNIVANTGGTANITLREIINGVKKGLFSYYLTLPNQYDVSVSASVIATMAFTPLSGQETIPGYTALADIDLYSGAYYDWWSGAYFSYGHVELPSGYWRVITTLEAPGKQTAVYRETVHIYEGFTTHYDKDFPPLNNTTYKVTIYDWNNTHTARAPVTVQHGHVFNPLPVPVAPPALSGFTIFDGWFTAPVGGTKWTTTTQVLRDGLNLYARWSQPDLDDLTININVDIKKPGIDPTIVVDDSDFAANGIIVFRISNHGNFVNGLRWFYMGNQLSNGTTGISIGSDYTLTYDFSLIPMSNILGTHVFTVEEIGGEEKSTETIVTLTYNP